MCLHTIPGATQEWRDQAVAAMRDWLAECTWADLGPDEVADLTDSEVIDGVRKHYSGGVQQFLRDGWMLADA